MATAVIELNALADAVGSAAEDHDLLAIDRAGLAFALVAGIEVRGEALKLGGAGIDAIEYRTHSQTLALFANGHLVSFPVARQLHVGDTITLGLAQVRGRNGIEGNFFQRRVELHHLRKLLQEPGVDRRHLLDLCYAASAFQSEPDI